MGVLEIMAKAGPRAKLSAPEIAAQMPSHNPNAAVMLELDRVLRLLVIHTVCFVALFHQLVMTAGYSVLHLWPNTCFVLNQDGVSLCPLVALAGNQALRDIWFVLQTFKYLSFFKYPLFFEYNIFPNPIVSM